ncbi:hypothetical protein KAR91_60155 [Candidatus Pacearchaeota archaeon]|nr:hypothetical protein [Candidatus Pacearchaeota archaeon]
MGFRSGISILVEAKTSRADFHADKKKIFRRNPSLGVGAFRFFLCPAGIIKPEDLPEKWGLLWVNEKGNIRQKIGPKGNIWNANGQKFFFSDRNIKGEWSMMVSALRRVHLRGDLGKIYDSPFKKQGTTNERK